MQKDYIGIIIKESLTDANVLDTLQVVSNHTETDQDNPDDTWHLYNVMVTKDEISNLQTYLERIGGWYMHFWKGEKVIVVFRDKLFEIDYDDKSTWKEAIDYGLSVGVPKEQIDFLIKE